MPKGKDTKNDPMRRPSNVISLDAYRASREGIQKPKRTPSPNHPSMQKNKDKK